MIDTHCHLTFRDFEGRVPAVIDRAREAGVTGMISISTTTQDCLDALAIASEFPNVWCSAGVHPLHADEAPHVWENVAHVASSPRCVAWGELGLDNHYDNPPRAVQHAVLAEQLAFIESQRDSGIDKPIVLHCRKAFDDLIPVLKASTVDPSRCVFHCFTGTPDDVRKVLDFGAWVSFTGVLTYKSAPEVREAAKLVPEDRLMVETDAPFLSPDPKRGVRPCEPWMVSFTAKRLAEVREQPFDAFHKVLNDNTERFFGVRTD
jgi:TatD DNase family protein